MPSFKFDLLHDVECTDKHRCLNAIKKKFQLFAVAEWIRIDRRVGNEMAIVTRQLEAKILIPDACHIVKPAFLSDIFDRGNLGMSVQG